MDQLLQWIYPNRLPLALVSILTGATVVLIGWRRGWHQMARRHPRISVALAALALVVAIPGGWYLGSPLILRTTLVEAAPTVAPRALATSAPTAVATTPLSTPLATASPTPRILAGQFKGADEFHFARGTARLIETEPSRFTLRLENFSVRNGPDLYVYLSPAASGYTKGAIELGRLKATDGSFNYTVPTGATIERVRSVVIWCKAFSVQFGVAALNE